MIIALVLLLYVAFVWRVHEAFHKRWRDKERTNVKTTRNEDWLGVIFPGLSYLWRGPDIILHNYTRGVPLALETPETSYIHVSSEKHINELKDAPEGQLSLHALSKDMFNPKYTMNGLEVHEDMVANGNLHTRAIQVGLRSNLPELYGPITKIVSNCFDAEFNAAAHPGQEWAKLSIASVAKKVVTAANALAFFGPELASSPVFLKAALDYPEDLFFTAEILRLVPSFLHPYLAPVLMRYHQGSNIMVEYMTPVVEERLRRQSSASLSEKDNGEKPTDCIQFFVDSNSRKGEWNAVKIVQVLLGIWFAAVHQPAMSIVYALEDLCDHSEYLDLIREEVSSLYEATDEIDPKTAAALIDNKPLLDAFLKESSRLHPSDSISVRRKVLEPFTFRDGTRLLAGDVVCVPSQAVMLDNDLYPDSSTFLPWRFLQADPADPSMKTLRTTSKFTVSDSTYPLWGLGRHSCPGRFYASLVIKVVIAHIITRYEIKLPPQNSPQKSQFRSSIVPKASSSLLIRRREIRPTTTP